MDFCKAVDLTHTISEIIPVYPGTAEPRLKVVATHEGAGYQETSLSIWSHTGTHMDAPMHIFPSRTALDMFPVSQFCGKALKVDCTSLRPGDRITMSLIDKLEEDAEFLLFHTGWDSYWGTPAYFEGYPYITEEVADYIISTKKKGVGFDTIGIDPVSDSGLSLHRRLFEKTDIVIIENLTNLGRLGSGPITFLALPLKYEQADGAPVRAIAINT